MPEIRLDVHPSGVAVEAPEGYTVREIEWDRGAGTRAVVRFDTRVLPELEDRLLPAKTYAVVDQNRPRDESIIGRFATLAEAEAVIVGLEYLAPGEVHDGRFGIDGPDE